MTTTKRPSTPRQLTVLAGGPLTLAMLVRAPERAARYAQALGYSEPQFVRLALQDEVTRAGLHYTVEVRAA